MIYFSLCPTHGLTEFSVAEQFCLACLGNMADLSPADRAAAMRRKFYDDICPTHGPAQFYASGQKCAQCFTKTGKPRKQIKRAVARRAGKPSYLDDCPTHGETAFGVGAGRCLTCYTQGGVLRRVAPPPIGRVLAGVALPYPVMRRAWPFKSMALGECATIPAEAAMAARDAANSLSRSGRRFMRRKQPDGSYLFWRVA